MAKNYTIKEATEIIKAGTDFEAITDIGRCYPVLAHKLAVLTAKAGDEVVDLMSYMPEYLSANKVNSAIKKSIEGGASDDDAEDDAAEVEDDTTEDAGSAEWNENMSAKQLWEILGKAGKRKLAKSTKKADLVEACKQAFGAAAEDEAEDDAEDATEEAGAYDGKSAMELFKECKKRGIKAPAKKPAKFYADLLTKNDAESGDAGDEGDDWDEDDAEDKEETKPAKKSAEKKAPAKSGKKAAKKEEDSDEDDWDI